MADQFTEFLDRPGAETYLALRDVIYASDVFDMNSDALLRLESAVRDERFEDVPEIQQALMPNFLLSMRAHLLLAQVAAHNNDEVREKSETRMAEACIFGLRSTGDGSPVKPYHAMHPADGYDLALALNNDVIEQDSREMGGTLFDVLTCNDGSEIWIDMTRSATAMAERAIAEA